MAHKGIICSHRSQAFYNGGEGSLSDGDLAKFLDALQVQYLCMCPYASIFGELCMRVCTHSRARSARAGTHEDAREIRACVQVLMTLAACMASEMLLYGPCCWSTFHFLCVSLQYQSTMRRSFCACTISGCDCHHTHMCTIKLGRFTQSLRCIEAYFWDQV